MNSSLEHTIADLVAKEVILTDFKDWKREGTVWTPNNIDYAFIYNIVENCIGYIPIYKNEDIEHLEGDSFKYKRPNVGIYMIHGGKNPYSSINEKSFQYDELSNFLDDNTKKKL